jgi:DNA-binding NarL/FixJ family response regulator
MVASHGPNAVSHDASDHLIKILVVDDHPVVRAGLAGMIDGQSDMQMVGEAGDGRAAVDAFRRRRPDVTLMDLKLPGTSGVEATREIRAEFPAARVLVLTTYDGDEDVYQALRAGACGYLLKDASRADLLLAIRAVHAGRRHVPPALAARVVERVAGEHLTSRELQVMRLVAEGKGNRAIAAELTLTEGTVKGYVHTLFEKLGVTHRAEAVVAAHKRGLVRLD